jgi:hypothetical protein
LLPYRKLDDTLSLTDTGADTLADADTGMQHPLSRYGERSSSISRTRP